MRANTLISRKTPVEHLNRHPLFELADLVAAAADGDVASVGLVGGVSLAESRSDTLASTFLLLYERIKNSRKSHSSNKT